MNTDCTDIKFIDSHNYHIFSVDTYQKTAPNGKTSKFVKLNAPDWVGAIVYDRSKNKYLCVKEYRHGVDKTVYQFPCGTVEEGENPIDALYRELHEELGISMDYLLGKNHTITDLFVGCPNPAFMNNKMYFYFIDLPEFVKTKQELDENEFVEPVWLTEDEVNNFLKEPDAAIIQQLAWKCL